MVEAMTNIYNEIIKNFQDITIPSEDEIVINNLQHYQYRYLKSYQTEYSKDQHSSQTTHMLGNFQGEIFEFFCYELLIKLTHLNSDISNILMKGPYIEKKLKKNKEGLSYSKAGEIIYYREKIAFAEFDALLKYKGVWFWVEITKSKQNKDVLIDRIYQKRRLLQLLFDQKQIICLLLVANPLGGKISEIDWLIQYRIPYPVSIESKLINIAQNVKENIKTRLKTKKQLYLPLKNLADINLDEYNTRLRSSFIKLWKKKITLTSFTEDNIYYIGLVRRIFLGILPIQSKKWILEKIPKAGMKKVIEKHNSKRIVVSVGLKAGEKAIIILLFVPNKVTKTRKILRVDFKEKQELTKVDYHASYYKEIMKCTKPKLTKKKFIDLISICNELEIPNYEDTKISLSKLKKGILLK